LSGGGVGLLQKATIVIYVMAVILFSYREGLTVYAKGAALLVVLPFLFRLIMKGDRIFIPFEYRVVAGWFLVGMLASVLSSNLEVSFARMLTIAQILPIAYVISSVIYKNGDGRFFWASIVVAGLLSTAIATVDPVRFSTIDGRVFGTLGNANTFAILLVGIVSIGMAIFAGSRQLSRQILGVLLAGLFFYLVAKTGSRMGMLASLVSIVIAVWSYQYNRTGRRLSGSLYWLLIGGSIIAASIAIAMSGDFATRLNALFMAVESGDFSSVGDNSLRGRATLYKKAFELFLESPLIGVGLDGFSTAGLNYRQIGNNAHSNYMEILCSTGLLGALFYFSIYVYWWVRCLALRKPLRGGPSVGRMTLLMSLAGAILVIDLAFVTYYTKVTWLLFAGIIGEMQLLNRTVRNATPVQPFYVRVHR
jgi:O-antigen ligase